jgi:hypothetical protein
MHLIQNDSQWGNVVLAVLRIAVILSVNFSARLESLNDLNANFRTQTFLKKSTKNEREVFTVCARYRDFKQCSSERDL